MGFLPFKMPDTYCKVFLVLVLQRATDNRINGALQLFYLNITSWRQDRHMTQEVNKNLYNPGSQQNLHNSGS